MAGKLDRQLIDFCQFADPEFETGDVPLTADLDPGTLLDSCRDHNVNAIVFRKLSEKNLTDHPDWHDSIAEAKNHYLYARATTMALADLGQKAAAALRKANIEHVIVKGEAFAASLYENRYDRPYTDVDILLPKQKLSAAAVVMQELGFITFRRQRFDRSEAKQEQKWGYRGDPQLLVELHTNLVHSPALRRRISFSYDDHNLAGDNGKRPYSAHFFTAIIHASAGHKFHQLRLLVDILQALRKLRVEDHGHIAEVSTKLRLKPEIAASLSLIEELFPYAIGECHVDDMRQALQLRDYPNIVKGITILRAPNNEDLMSRLTRHTFRLYQKHFAARN